MIKSITVTNYLGESIKIVLTQDNPEHGLIIKSIDGLGPAKATINTMKTATDDGTIFNTAQLASRNINIKFILCEAPTIEATRQRVYKYFPIKKPLTFLIETDNRYVETEGYVESNEPDIFKQDESTSITIVCPDPYFYSAGEKGITTTIFNGTESLFEFPFSNESTTKKLIEFGSIKILTERTVYYDGDAETGVIITIHALGEAGNITLYNTQTREAMKINASIIESLTGHGIIAGDDIIISTVRGKKSVTLLRNGHYTNILNAIDKNSDWFTLAKGDNLFAYSVDKGLENLQFKMETKTLYEGV